MQRRNKLRRLKGIVISPLSHNMVCIVPDNFNFKPVDDLLATSILKHTWVRLKKMFIVLIQTTNFTLLLCDTLITECYSILKFSIAQPDLPHSGKL